MFKVEVLAAGESRYVCNALRFETVAEADSYAVDLACRWTAVKDWRVVEADPREFLERRDNGQWVCKI